MVNDMKNPENNTGKACCNIPLFHVLTYETMVCYKKAHKLVEICVVGPRENLEGIKHTEQQYLYVLPLSPSEYLYSLVCRDTPYCLQLMVLIPPFVCTSGYEPRIMC